jgi:hypothetical protein
MEPLDKMFRDAGLRPMICWIRSARAIPGGRAACRRSRFPPRAAGRPRPEEIRANAILQGLDRMNMYRIAAFKAPFAMPVNTPVRYTSGFGGRNDPFGAAMRRHEGQDMAGAYGAADPCHGGWRRDPCRLGKRATAVW